MIIKTKPESYPPLLQAAINAAFSRVVKSMPAWSFPNQSSDEVVATLVSEALQPCFEHGSISPVVQCYWELVRGVDKANQSRAAPIVLPRAADFAKLVQREQARRWFDNRFRKLAPSQSATTQALLASALRLVTLQAKVVCWSVAEMLYNLHGWGYGLAARLKQLSFESVLPKNSRNAPVSEFGNLLPYDCEYLEHPLSRAVPQFNATVHLEPGGGTFQL